jgi:hypothetical protein
VSLSFALRIFLECSKPVNVISGFAILIAGFTATCSPFLPNGLFYLGMIGLRFF